MNDEEEKSNETIKKGTVTSLLEALPQEHNQLYELVYEHLKAIAHNRISAQDRANALDTTALVNEAYLKLARRTNGWRDRRHFYGVAAEAMRRILIDAARGRDREKRGGGLQQHSLSGVFTFDGENWEEDLLELDEALEALAKHSAEFSEIVQLRFFSGLTVKECAEVLDVSVSTVERRWRFARAWLHAQIARNS
ncbi:MAG: ECF-type sigma factor [Planctomycetota bacterium]